MSTAIPNLFTILFGSLTKKVVLVTFQRIVKEIAFGLATNLGVLNSFLPFLRMPWRFFASISV